ncbi:MAG: hypothetical protein WD232_02660 [Acidimicrobiales bacterium]
MPNDHLPPPPPGRCPGVRLRRLLAAIALATTVGALGACSGETPGDGVAPEDADPGPAEMPGAEDDPTLSGEDGAPGVGDGRSGGTGSGSPDSGGVEGEVGDSPTAGETG